MAKPDEVDWARAREETPGCRHVLHFNNAGAALQPEPVAAAVRGYLELETAIGGYEAAEARNVDLERVYDAAAALIGAGRDEIAIVENATYAWDMAFFGVPLEPGDRILTSKAAYASSYIAFLQAARRTGAVIETVPSDEDGQISLTALADMLDDRVKLIELTHIPTNGGLINPAAAVGELARQVGALYLLDACQSVGQIPVDVGEIGCHMLSATGRKYLRGPRGTGFLYVSREILDQLDPPFLDLHGADWVAPDRYRMRPDARRFESWESNCAAKAGLGVAIDYALGWGMPAIGARVVALGERLRRRLGDVPGAAIRDLGRARGGIVSFELAGKRPNQIRDALRARNINLSVTEIGSTRLDMQERNIEAMVRASVHYYNTEGEIERFCEALASL